MARFEPNEKQRAWIEALRSGNYKQTSGQLRTSTETGDGGYGFCCLGVRLDVEDPDGWDDTVWESDDGDMSTEGDLHSLGEAGIDMVGLSLEDQELLICLNDGVAGTDKLALRGAQIGVELGRGYSFSEIADTIEKLWEVRYGPSNAD